MCGYRTTQRKIEKRHRAALRIRHVTADRRASSKGNSAKLPTTAGPCVQVGSCKLGAKLQWVHGMAGSNGNVKQLPIPGVPSYEQHPRESRPFGRLKRLLERT